MSQPAQSPRPAVTFRPPPRVLLVDDSAAMRALLRQHLACFELHYLEAASAEEALALLEQESVELVITDLHMAEGARDGLDLAQAMRVSADVRLRTVPVLLAAREEDVAAVRRRSTGTDVLGFLYKPVQRLSLLKLVEAALPSVPTESTRARAR